MATQRIHLPSKYNQLRASDLVRRTFTRRKLDEGWDFEAFTSGMADVLKRIGEQDRQNWLEIERWSAGLGGAGSSFFHAIVNPEDDENAGEFIFNTVKTAYDAVSGSFSSGDTVNIGIIGTDTAMVETGDITLNSNLALFAIPQSGQHGSGIHGEYAKPIWQDADVLANGNVDVGQNCLYVHGLTLVNCLYTMTGS